MEVEGFSKPRLPNRQEPKCDHAPLPEQDEWLGRSSLPRVLLD